MRKFFGVAVSLLTFGSAGFFVMALSDLLTGGSPETGAGVLAGLAVFFGGLTVSTGYASWRLLTTNGASARRPEIASLGIDINLEARVLALAATKEGRVTMAEVAVACAVSLDQAEHALDGLTQRGHADLHITEDGERVYVVKGFLSVEEKQRALDVVEATRS